MDINNFIEFGKANSLCPYYCTKNNIANADVKSYVQGLSLRSFAYLTQLYYRSKAENRLVSLSKTVSFCSMKATIFLTKLLQL